MLMEADIGVIMLFMALLHRMDIHNNSMSTRLWISRKVRKRKEPIGSFLCIHCSFVMV